MITSKLTIELTEFDRFLANQAGTLVVFFSSANIGSMATSTDFDQLENLLKARANSLRRGFYRHTAEMGITAAISNALGVHCFDAHHLKYSW